MSLPKLRQLSSLVARQQRTRRHLNTVSEAEIAHFSKLASAWWDPFGEFGALHRMNQSRVDFTRDRLMAAGTNAERLNATAFLEGLKVLDVGCGGGLFSENLARLGAQTLGIDAAQANINVAVTHAAQDVDFAGLQPRYKLDYRHCAAEQLIEEDRQYDIVCAMEVLEHVEDPRSFLSCLNQLLKPGGHLILSTISRTPFAKLLTIDIAENSLFGFVTPGTHTYSKYVKPEELRSLVANELGWTTPMRSLADMETRGVFYLPWKGTWQLSSQRTGPHETAGWDQLANYFFGARKPLEA